MFLKKVDGLVGSLLVRLLPRPGREESPVAPAAVSRLLLIRPGGIGDAVLLIPAVRAFKEAFPDSEVTVLAERRNGAAFALCPEVDQVLLYDRPKQLLCAMRQRYDVVIDAEQWHRLSAVVTRFVRSDRKIGFGSNERRRLFNVAVPYAHEDYEADSFQHLLTPLGIAQQTVCCPFLRVPEFAAKRAVALLDSLRGRPFVTLFPGASIPERRWGTDKFHRLAAWLNERGFAVVTVGGGQDAEAGEAIVAGCRGINLAGRTSLVETAAVLQRSRLLTSGDSGLLHLAVGLDVPTVSLFGPGIAAKWAPCGEKHIVLNKNLSCSPCTRFGTTPSCPKGARCLREISVDEVARAVSDLLERQVPTDR
jgi:lipopolysaccharide heptosyltransferase II